MSNLDFDDNDISYESAQKYWSDIPATVDGVLGGFGFISDIDIEGSRIFLESLLSCNKAPCTDLALDCGAGIGRITKNLLLPYFQLVDVVEPDSKFIKTIKNYVGEHQSKIDTLYEVGLQDFNPVKRYDVIWNQWVLGYLLDQDLIAYLKRCRYILS